MRKFLVAMFLLFSQQCLAAENLFWIGPTIEWSTIKAENTSLIGFRVGYTPSEFLGVGLRYQRVASSISHTYENVLHSVSYSSYGLFAEPTLLPQRPVQITLPITVSLGQLDLSSQAFKEKRSGGWFSSMDAGIFLERKFTSTFRASIGGGIRMMSGIDSYGLSSHDFRTVFAGLSLKWGSNEPESP